MVVVVASAVFAHKARVLQISLLAIMSAFAVELVLGLVSGSLALVTDSVHALLDGIVTVVLILAVRMAARPPDAEHTYGHGKIESLGGLFGGIAILFVAGFFIYESASRLHSPAPVEVLWTVGMAAGIYTIGVDVFRVALLRRSIREAEGGGGGGTALRADLYHAFMDMGSTGLAVAGIVMVHTGVFPQGDFAAALILGGLLAVLSIKLIHRTAMDLTDVIAPEMVEGVGRAVRGIPDVTDVKSVLMRRSGDVVFADVTVSLRGDVSFERAHEISTAVEDEARREVGRTASVTVHFEPSWEDVPREARIKDAVVRIPGVRDVHNISVYGSESGTYANMHVMVDGEMDLSGAHSIADAAERAVQDQFAEIDHVTVHLEPHVAIPAVLRADGVDMEGEIRRLAAEYPEIIKVTRILCLNFEDVHKIEMDCSFDGGLSIAAVHDVTADMEKKIKDLFKNSLVTIHTEPAG